MLDEDTAILDGKPSCSQQLAIRFWRPPAVARRPRWQTLLAGGQLNDAIDQVAAKLVNTRAVC